MIKYTLQCDASHEFESWFSNSKSFESQAHAHLIACPICTSTAVEKAVMAPNVSRRTKPRTSSQPKPKTEIEKFEILAHAEKIIADIKKRTEYVGDDFASEARKIHEKEAPARPIWGIATKQETSDLADDGITVLPLPRSTKKHS